MFQAAIFDFDGVIVDSETCWEKPEYALFTMTAPGWKPEDRARLIGLTPEKTHAMLTKDYGATLPLQEFLDLFDRLAKDIYAKETSLLPGVLELLTDLKKHDFPIAIATSSPSSWIEIALKRFGLTDVFTAVVSAPALKLPSKPDPAVYRYAAEALKTDPAHCVAFEDSRNGVLSAKAAGIYCIGIQNDPKQELSDADRIVRSCGEVTWGDFCH